MTLSPLRWDRFQVHCPIPMDKPGNTFKRFSQNFTTTPRSSLVGPTGECNACWERSACDAPRIRKWTESRSSTCRRRRWSCASWKCRLPRGFFTIRSVPRPGKPSQSTCSGLAAVLHTVKVKLLLWKKLVGGMGGKHVILMSRMVCVSCSFTVNETSDFQNGNSPASQPKIDAWRLFYVPII